MCCYQERLKVAEISARFVEIGFMSFVKEAAEALSICPKEDVKAISEQLALAVKAVEFAEYDVEYYKEQCEKEDEI